MRLLSFAALLAVASITHAADEPARDSGKKPEAEQKVIKVACRREKPVGTQMVKRRCFTQEQLDIEREQSRNIRVDP